MGDLALELFSAATHYSTGTCFLSKGWVVNQRNEIFRVENLFPKFITDSNMKEWCFPTNSDHIPLGIIQSSWDWYDVSSSSQNHITNGRVILHQEINHLIEIYILSFREMHLKMSSRMWRPFWLGVNVLKAWSCIRCVKRLSIACLVARVARLFGCIFLVIINVWIIEQLK